MGKTLVQGPYHHPIFWLLFLIPIAVIVTSCGKQADSKPEETASAVQTSDKSPTPEPPAAKTPEPEAATPEGPKVPVMIITYQTQSTPSQGMFPPGVRLAPTLGQEIRYLDLANNRMRIENTSLRNRERNSIRP